MARWMVALVGEQPMPVYSLIRQPELEPNWVLFVASDRTREVVQRMRHLLRGIPSEVCIVQPYDINDVMAALEAELAAVPAGDTVIFNLTGGTKTMVFGALEVARQRSAEVVYLKSEADTQLFRYWISPAGIQEMPPLAEIHPIRLHEYLAIHAGEFGEQPPEKFLAGVACSEIHAMPPSERGRVLGRLLEREVRDTLLDARIDEFKVGIDLKGIGGQEIDFALRIGNSYGIGSIKSGRLKDKEIQIIEEIAAIGQNRLLGTYVKKFIVVTKQLEDNTKKLCKAYDVTPIELLSFAEQHRLSDEDRTKLVNAIVEAMRPKTSRTAGQPG